MLIKTSSTNTSVPANSEVVLETINPSDGKWVQLIEIVVKLGDSTNLSLQIRENGINVFQGPQALSPTLLYNQISGGTLLDGGDTSLKCLTYVGSTTLDYTIGWEPNFSCMLQTPVEIVVKNSSATTAFPVKSYYLIVQDKMDPSRIR